MAIADLKNIQDKFNIKLGVENNEKEEIQQSYYPQFREVIRKDIKTGTPQVVSVGALDMVNFGPFDTVPDQYSSRNLYKHNPTVTLMRTSVSENVRIAEKLAEKWNNAERKMTLMLPIKGVFHD